MRPARKSCQLRLQGLFPCHLQLRDGQWGSGPYLVSAYCTHAVAKTTRQTTKKKNVTSWRGLQPSWCQGMEGWKHLILDVILNTRIWSWEGTFLRIIPFGSSRLLNPLTWCISSPSYPLKPSLAWASFFGVLTLASPIKLGRKVLGTGLGLHLAP